MIRRWLILVVALTVGGCAAASRPAADPRAIDECRDFAEQTAPRGRVRGNGSGRSTVYPTQDAESLATLFDLCMQARDALK